jgi:hypothetical protein
MGACSADGGVEGIRSCNLVDDVSIDLSVSSSHDIQAFNICLYHKKNSSAKACNS